MKRLFARQFFMIHYINQACDCVEMTVVVTWIELNNFKRQKASHRARNRDQINSASGLTSTLRKRE